MKARFESERQANKLRLGILHTRKWTSPGTYEYILWFEKDNKGIKMVRANEIDCIGNETVILIGNIWNIKYKELSKYLNQFLDRFKPSWRAISFEKITM